jgi:hypothetical protein
VLGGILAEQLADHATRGFGIPDGKGGQTTECENLTTFADFHD